MQVKVSMAPWFPMVIDLMVRLSLMGYQITQDDIDELIQSALIFEAD